MRIIAIGNLKGGVGKSTIAVNIACELAAASGPRRPRVALVDADEQATASEWAAEGKLPVPVLALPLTDPADAEGWMSRISSTEADFVLIDLPPNIGASTAAALVLADLFVVPITPSGLDLRAASKAIDLLHEARQERGDGKPACLLVPSKVDRRTAVGREIEAALVEFGEPVAPAIGLRSAFVDSGGASDWIGTYAARSVGHTEVSAVAAVIRKMVSK
jgi:chromosome partitioning protein